MLTLAIIHFEFLDTDIMQVSSNWPRLSLWTSEIVAEYERMDCISTERLLYDRLPTKHVSETPFSRCNNQDKFPPSSSYDELQNFLLSITTEENKKKVMDKLPSIMDNMHREMLESIQPVFTKSIINLLKCMPSAQISATSNIPSIRKIDEYHEVPPMISGRQHAGDLPLEAPTFNLQGQSVMKNDRDSIFKCTKGQQLGLKAGADEETTPKEPSTEVLETRDKEAIAIPDIQDLLKSLTSIKLPADLGLPHYPELLEAMIPQKVQVEICEFSNSLTHDLLSYMLEDQVYWEQHKHETWEKDSKSLRKIDLFEGFDIPSSPDCIAGSSNPGGPTTSCRTEKQNKRSTCLSLNEMAVNCIALKKRARMFEMKSELAEDTSFEVEHSVDHDITTAREPLTNTKDVNLTPQTHVHPNTYRADNDFPWDDPELVAELLDTTYRAEEQYYAQKSQSQSQFITPERERIQIAGISLENFCCSFISTPVEKEVFNDIIARVPKTTKQKTIKMIQMGTTWVENRVFALSMMVYGNVIKYVINMMGKAVIAELVEKKRFDLLPSGYWSKYYMECDTAALFQKAFENPGSLCVLLKYNVIGFMLDKINMVHMPLFTSGFWYLIVANFRKKMFEVLYPNNKIHLIVDEENHTINNFKGAFDLAYKHSEIRVFEMPTSFRSVCSSNREGDSGVFIMKLIQCHDGDTTLSFEPEHAKSLRESLTYYMLSHPCNERMPPETKAILQKYGIPYDYTTPGYSPWG